MPKQKFRISVRLYDYAYIDVEAEDVDEARKKAAAAYREDYKIFDGGYCETLRVEPNQ